MPPGTSSGRTGDRWQGDGGGRIAGRDGTGRLPSGRRPVRHVAEPNDDIVPDGAAAAGHVDYRTLVEQIPCITYTEVHDSATSKGQRTTFVSPQAMRILG